MPEMANIEGQYPNPPQHPQKLSKQKNKFGNRRPNKQTVLKKRSLSNYKITDLFESATKFYL